MMSDLSPRLWITPNAVDISALADEATPADLLAVLTSMGAEVVEAWREPLWPDGRAWLLFAVEPGEYVVIPKSRFETCDGSGQCAAVTHIEGCYRSRPKSRFEAARAVREET